EVAAEYPLFFSQHDTAAWAELVAEYFAKDAVVCLFTKVNRGQLLEHLRIMSHARPQSTDPAAGILGICWPSVLNMLLSGGDPAFVERLMSGIDAVLVYPRDAPETGFLYGGESLGGVLRELGFQP